MRPPKDAERASAPILRTKPTACEAHQTDAAARVDARVDDWSCQPRATVENNRELQNYGSHRHQQMCRVQVHRLR